MMTKRETIMVVTKLQMNLWKNKVLTPILLKGTLVSFWIIVLSALMKVTMKLLHHKQQAGVHNLLCVVIMLCKVRDFGGDKRYQLLITPQDDLGSDLDASYYPIDGRRTVYQQASFI